MWNKTTFESSLLVNLETKGFHFIFTAAIYKIMIS